MTKFSVTSELSALIKIMRMQSKIASKKLAKHIGKSPSFVSKLESNEIKMIQEEDLTAILDYIIEGDDFYNDKLPAIMKTLSSFHNAVNISEQIWFLHYDSLRRPILVPEQMIDDINARMKQLGIDARQISEKANANQEAAMSPAFPPNELVDYMLQENRVLVIRVSVDESEVSALLQKKKTEINYFLIHCLIFTLLRTEAYGDDDLTVGEAAEVLQNVREYLERYKVYSIAELSRALSMGGDFETQQNFLSIVSTTSTETVNQIINHFRLASEHDKLLAAKELKDFHDNLAWDRSFMMKLIGLHFFELDDISFSLKKQLIEDMISLLEKYRKIPESKKTIETY